MLKASFSKLSAKSQEKIVESCSCSTTIAILSGSFPGTIDLIKAFF